MSQFSGGDEVPTLADYINIPNVYPAGRLDKDSEGLMVLTDDGQLQSRISSPKHKMRKTYWVQVEGDVSQQAIDELERGVRLKDGMSAPAQAIIIPCPNVWERVPPIRERKSVADSWLQLTITEGKNRQVRRMTAAVGFPTLRLIRYAIGDWSIDNIANGKWVNINQPR